MAINVFPVPPSGVPSTTFTHLKNSTNLSKTFTVSYPAGVYKISFDGENAAPTSYGGFSTNTNGSPTVTITDSTGATSYKYATALQASGTYYTTPERSLSAAPRYFYSTGITQISSSMLGALDLIYTSPSASSFGFKQIIYEASETNKYVAVGGAANEFFYAYSTNGTSWTQSSLSNTSVDSNVNTIVYYGTSYYAAGNYNTSTNGSRVYVSTDGATWTTAYDGSTFSMTSGAKNNNYIVFTGHDQGFSNTTYSFYSTNGVSWNLNLFNGNGFPGITIGGGADQFVTTAGTRIWATTNPNTWSNVDASLTNGEYVAGAYNGSTAQKYVLGSINTTSGSSRVYSSTNGTTWTARTVGTNSVNAGSILFAESQWILIPRETTAVATCFTSTDAITWTSRSFSTLPASSVRSRFMTYDGTKYYSIFEGKTIYNTSSLSGTTPYDMSIVLEGPYTGIAEQ